MKKSYYQEQLQKHGLMSQKLAYSNILLSEVKTPLSQREYRKRLYYRKKNDTKET